MRPVFATNTQDQQIIINADNILYIKQCEDEDVDECRIFLVGGGDLFVKSTLDNFKLTLRQSMI